MFTINNFSISKLNNAEFTALMINIQKAITSSDPAKLGLVEVLPSFGSTLQKLIDQVYTTSGSEFTAAMLDADVKRDQTYKCIRLRLQMVEVAEDSAAIKAVKDVVKTHLLSKYTSKVPQLPYQEESSILQGFLYDLQDKLGDEGISALGISDDMAALEEANDAFISAYNQRATERAEGYKGLTVKIRQEMFALYQQICFITQYLANSTDTANAEKAPVCQAFIAVLNVYLADAKKRYNQRTNNGTDEEGEGGEGGNTNPDDSGTDAGNDAGNGTNQGSNQNTENSGSGSGDNSGSGSGDLPTDATNGSNTTDPNKPSEGGVVNGDEVSF